MIDFQKLETLARVFEEQSFEKAAERLHITQSAVSQRIQQLERSLGHVLLIRTTPLQLTEQGQLVIKTYRQISMLESDLHQALGGKEQQSATQSIAIGSNADSLATWLLDALDPILRNENIVVDIKVDDQDRTHELLRKGDVIGCISASNEAILGCNCFPLGIMTYRCLVSPEFKQRYFKNGVSAATIRKAPCVEFNHKDDLERRYLSTFFDLPLNMPCHRIPSTESFLSFVARGHAWGLIPDIQSKPERERGELVELLPGCHFDIPLYWHIWNLKTRLNRLLTDALLREAKHGL
ncbi:MAG: LysR family transcriptional regulator ArgP [Pseudomonadales bacterium]|nr:LysR family transcriptional regulator ArgP [Pseudomonadales bacterium]